MKPAASTPPPRGRKALFVTVGVLALALAGLGVQRWLGWREAQARRAAVLADVIVEVLAAGGVLRCFHKPCLHMCEA